MSDVNAKKLESSTTEAIMGSINFVIDSITALFSTAQTPLTPLPPPLLLFGAELRPGIDADTVCARIISRQHQAGLIEGDQFADQDSTTQRLERIRMEEIVFALKNEAKVEVAIAPGISVYTVGVGNLGMPVVSVGETTSLTTASGVIR